MSRRAALTMGSGIRTETVSRGGGAFAALKRLKSGQEKFGKAIFGQESSLNFGREGRLKSGKAKALKPGKAKGLEPGKALAVAPPTIARAANDTMIAGTRLEGPCGGTSGGLLSCVALSGVSATCVPTCQTSPKISPHHPIKNKNAVAWTIPRQSRDCPAKISLN